MKRALPQDSDDDDLRKRAVKVQDHEILPEVKIVLLYIILASVWIVVSDVLLAKWTGSGTRLGVAQSIKGLNFVLTTAVLLFFVLRRAYGGWRQAEERRLSVMKKARERYRQLCASVQELQEEDRARISREVHDELGQLLTGIKMEVRMVENGLTERENRTLNPMIDRLVELAEMVDETITSVQRIAADLRPSVLEHLGLSAALNEEAEQFSKRSEIQCDLQMDDLAAPLPPDLEMTIFRIFQESLTNIARHSNAAHVVAKFTLLPAGICLSVRDDGGGLNAAMLDAPESLGIVGMHERAENVGGAVNFKFRPEGGTEVIFTVPTPESPSVSLR